jgi:hypothetical protein
MNSGNPYGAVGILKMGGGKESDTGGILGR